MEVDAGVEVVVEGEVAVDKETSTERSAGGRRGLSRGTPEDESERVVVEGECSAMEREVSSDCVECDDEGASIDGPVVRDVERGVG